MRNLVNRRSNSGRSSLPPSAPGCVCRQRRRLVDHPVEAIVALQALLVRLGEKPSAALDSAGVPGRLRDLRASALDGSWQNAQGTAGSGVSMDTRADDAVVAMAGRALGERDGRREVARRLGRRMTRRATLVPRRRQQLVVRANPSRFGLLRKSSASRPWHWPQTNADGLAVPGGVAPWLPWQSLQVGADRSSFSRSAAACTLCAQRSYWSTGSGRPSASV